MIKFIPWVKMHMEVLHLQIDDNHEDDKYQASAIFANRHSRFKTKVCLIRQFAVRYFVNLFILIWNKVYEQQGRK